MKVIIATSEAVPYAKTGGLADVTGTLLEEFRDKNQDVSMILPLYASIKEHYKLYRTNKSVKIMMHGTAVTGDIWIDEDSPNPRCYFIECEAFYGRPELYGTSSGDYPDNARRFIFFARAVLEACIAMNIQPDVIHCNDWQTALIPLYLKTLYKGNILFKQTATLYTIHNLGYAGLFSSSDMRYTGLGWDYFTPDRLEFYGRLNFMKAGLLYSDLLNTVSETYAREIIKKTYGFGLEGVLKTRLKDIYGVINGVNYSEWDSAKDLFIPEPYNTDNLKGKERCKEVLLKATGITEKRLPLMGIVSRLSWQKGVDLVYKSLNKFISMVFNIIILGKGEDYYQKVLSKFAADHSDRVYVRIGFEESLAHQIYAGSDFFLMPSRYEPCGLGQLIAMKYGSIPIARQTGGLADTIRDYDHLNGEGTGFLFSEFTSSSLQDATKRALCVYSDSKRMKRMVLEAMETDFSWTKSADKYLELYKKAAKKVKK
jgi:starch synthase